MSELGLGLESGLGLKNLTATEINHHLQSWSSQRLAHAFSTTIYCFILHTLAISYFRISYVFLQKTVVNMIVLELITEVPSCQ